MNVEQLKRGATQKAAFNYLMSSIKRHLVIDPKSLLHSFFHFANCITLHKGKHKVLIWYVMLEGFLGHNKLVLN